MLVDDLFESAYSGNTERAIARNMVQSAEVDEGFDVSNLTNVAQALGKLKGREAFVRIGDPSKSTKFKRGVIFDRENNYGIAPGTGSSHTYWLKDESGKDFKAPSRDVFVAKEEVAEGDVAKLAGITALGIGAGLGANYLDQQAPRVEFDGKNGPVRAYLEPAYSNRIPDNAMTIKGKDGKTYHVWTSSGKGMNSKSYHAAPVEQVKEGVAEGEVVGFPKKHKGDLSKVHSCPKCGGDLQGGKYMGHEVKVCMPCKQVYLPPNSGIDKQGNKIAEAAKGILHRVRYQYDDPSGSGIASGYITLHAPDKTTAARYAVSDLSKKGKKNVQVKAVTPQTQEVAEGADERKQNALWAQITDYEKRAKATKNDIKKAHYEKMANELRSKLKTNVDEGEVYDLEKEYGYEKPKHQPRRASEPTIRRSTHPEDTDFMDPVERRLRADQERVRAGWAAHNAKKGVAESLSVMIANATSRDDLRQIRNFVTENVSDKNKQRQIMEQATQIVAVQRRKHTAVAVK